MPFFPAVTGSAFFLLQLSCWWKISNLHLQNLPGTPINGLVRNGFPCYFLIPRSGVIIYASFYMPPPKTNTSPLKVAQNSKPKRKPDHLPTIHFQVLLVLVSGSVHHCQNTICYHCLIHVLLRVTTLPQMPRVWMLMIISYIRWKMATFNRKYS